VLLKRISVINNLNTIKIMNTEITTALVKKIAQNDYKELCKKIGKLSFENAFKALDSFNLSVETSCRMMFDFNFGCLNGTIFSTARGGCKIHYVFDIWLDEFSSPIARALIHSEDDVEITLFD
jgi:hypothetical protein